ARAALFKALGHPVRLLILNLIKKRPRHTEELATILLLKPATVSFHLSQLQEASLLESRRDQYYQIYSLAGNVLRRPLSDIVFLAQPELGAQVKEDAYRKKVLGTFIHRGRLTQFPAQRSKQQIVLERLAEEFEPDHEYTEREVNRILVEFYDDVATLRRGLVEHGLVERAERLYRRCLSTPAR
ncbi:MAG: metalloregulator ArsR/SmtB family transcription factor, partial [Chloroflexi bacterium]|nr:metalloregulator ArsR/SmtB family transcription factor [Chloroflexota bacterium]